MKTSATLPLIDSHAHVMNPASLTTPEFYHPPTVENAHSMVKMLEKCGYSALAIPCITLWDERDLPANPLALYAKTLSPERIYAFAGLRRFRDREANAGMAEQVRSLLPLGFDGVKMICKPNARLELGLAMNDPIFDDFYAYLQENDVPILYHVGDPASFWDPGAPDWAKARGWYYGDWDVPDLEGFYAEAIDVLERFPLLPVTFAHFFFMSGDLRRAACLFDRFPRLCFDVTPGREMYEDFSNNHDETREFFMKYQDRIIFGTDNIGGGESAAETQIDLAERVGIMRRFFETGEVNSAWEFTLRGLDLPPKVCRKLYRDNFMSRVHNQPPKKVNPRRAEALCAEYLTYTADAATMKTLEELRGLFAGM